MQVQAAQEEQASGEKAIELAGASSLEPGTTTVSLELKNRVWLGCRVSQISNVGKDVLLYCTHILCSAQMPKSKKTICSLR